ncbi:MAG: hypothetical protein ACTS6J_07340 [Burkholderiales bacterium]
MRLLVSADGIVVVACAGVGGALIGGFLTTSAMLSRDAMKLMRLVKEWRPGGLV